MLNVCFLSQVSALLKVGELGWSEVESIGELKIQPAQRNSSNAWLGKFQFKAHCSSRIKMCNMWASIAPWRKETNLEQNVTFDS
jgi:hypothetical protein